MSDNLPDSAAGGILILLPPSSDLIAPYLEPLSIWLKTTSEQRVCLLIPKPAEALINLLDADVETVTFEKDEIKRNGFPSKTLKARIRQRSFRIAILLAPEVHILSEILFALAPAKLKAAGWDGLRDGRANFLVRAKEDSTPARSTSVLLDYVSQFVLQS